MIVYLASKAAPPGSTTSIMGIISVPATYLPWFLVTLDLIVGGPGYAVLSVAGALVGHIWWWSVWGGRLASQGRYASWGRAPQWLSDYMGENSRGRARAAQDPAGGTAASLASGGIHVSAPFGRRTTDAGPDIGQHRWGSGQKLGTT